MKRILLLSLLFVTLLVPALPLAAEGAGGLLFQVVKPAWNPAFLGGETMPYDLEFMGGYGYGVTEEGMVIGGFGMGFFDTNLVSYDYDRLNPHLAGGVGGVILGSRVIGTRSAHLDLDCRLGLGGVGSWGGTAGARGYAICYAEPYAELGLGLTPWMHLSATLGYTVMGNLIPGRFFSDLFDHSPTLGFTLSFGDFRRSW